MINPFPLGNDDLNRLNELAVVSSSSGDISTSDVLSWGKIPLVDRGKKIAIYYGLYKKLEEFCADDPEKNKMMKAWVLASRCFQKKGPHKFDITTEEDFLLLDLVNTGEYQKFQKEFTDWLKSKNQLYDFIHRELQNRVHSDVR